MRGISANTGSCLADIAQTAGFTVAAVAQRKIDGARRMLPTSAGTDDASGIEQRMNQQHVIGLVKP